VNTTIETLIDPDSLAKANFVRTVLRVARSADIQTAIRLLEALTTERPHSKTNADIAAAHLEATRAIAELADALRNGSASENRWTAAMAAAEAWRQMVDRPAIETADANG
jgi:hypothetical protein